jgi:hypothetical protein
MSDDEIKALYHKAIKLDEKITSDPDIIDRIKQITWFAIQYVNKVQSKDINAVIHKQSIDEFIEYELGLRENIGINPYKED